MKAVDVVHQAVSASSTASPQSSLRASSFGPSSNPCVEEAIQLVASRDAVYFDPLELAWKSSIPVASLIRTRLGHAKCLMVRASDGIVVCSHPCGTLYLSPLGVTQTPEGEFIDAGLLPSPPGPGDDSECPDSDRSHGRSRPTEVDLRGCQLEHQDVARLSRALAGNYFVTSLALSGNHLGDSDMAVLADALAHAACVLESLLLSYNAISALGSTLLATALRDNARLRVLDLSHNRIGREGVRPWLGSTLCVNHSLLELRLSHNGIGDAKASELLDALAPKATSQEEVIKSQIARRRHTTAVMPSVVTLMAQVHEQEDGKPFNSSVTTLLLADTSIGDEAARHLAHALSKTRSLMHLDVSCNAFSAQGVLLIARALERNASLVSLTFSDNVVEDAGAASALLKAAGSHPSLETTRFQACFPSGHSAVAMAAAELLTSTKTIVTLDLSHCLLEPPGAVEFYRALAHNRSLRHLELMCSGLRSDGAAAVLARALAENEALETLDVAYNALTLRGCKLLRDAAQAREEQRGDSAGGPTGKASCAHYRRRLFVSLEGNSGEKRVGPGVTVAGGHRHAQRSANDTREPDIYT